MRRTGIDLSPTRCIVVDAEISGRRRKQGEARSLRVHQFAASAHADNSQALTAELKGLINDKAFSKRAWVNLWDVQSIHQYLLLPAARKPGLDAIARQRSAALLGLDPRDVAVATSIGATRGEPKKTELSFFGAGLQELRHRLRPIVDAGFAVEGVTTPCGALWSQARLRRPPLKDEVHAYVSVGATLSALAIFSNGFLLYARDLNWGYAESPLGSPTPLSREDLAARLSTELKRSFLYLKQYWENDVSQVLLCGDMPEIRSLTAPLIERLNIEVETLDTLDGIDTAALPEPADRFTEQVAGFRLASAIAVEPPPVNLLPVEVTFERVNPVGQRLLALGSAASVAFGAFLYGQAGVEKQAAALTFANLQRQLSVAEPQGRAINVAQRTSEIEADRWAMIEALDTQGPRVARMLEALSQAAGRDVRLKAVRVLPDSSLWRVSVEALAEDLNPARARAAAESFLENLEGSPLFGAPVRPASQRILATGVELTVDFTVRK